MVRYTTFLSFGRLLLFMATAVLLQTAAQSQPAVPDQLSQPQFVNPLPIPQTINVRSGGTFTITVSQTEQDLGLVDPINGQHLLTKIWGCGQHGVKELAKPIPLLHTGAIHFNSSVICFRKYIRRAGA